jgi:hypothetical protein
MPRVNSAETQDIEIAWYGAEHLVAGIASTATTSTGPLRGIRLRYDGTPIAVRHCLGRHGVNALARRDQRRLPRRLHARRRRHRRHHARAGGGRRVVGRR